MSKELKITYAADTSSVSSAVRSIDNMHAGLARSTATKGKSLLSSLGSSMARFGKALALPLIGGVALGLGGAITLLAKWSNEAEEAQAVSRELHNTIRTMGKVAGVTAEELLKQNEQLSLMTGIDDDLITKGTNLLVTFGNIRNEVGRGNDILTQANALMVDYAAKFTDGNLRSAATQLGKALDNPIKGLTALTRVGVSFTDQETKIITKLVEHNKLMEAQKLIMAAVEKQVSGTAKKSATSTDKLTNAWAQFTEWVGTKVLPLVRPVLNSVRRFITDIIGETDDVGEAWKKLTGKLNEVWESKIKPFFRDKVIPALKEIFSAFFQWVRDQFSNLLGNMNIGVGFSDQQIDRILSGAGAAGAIVTRPTRAIIGEAGPEMVIPLDQMPGARPLGEIGHGGSAIIVHVHVAGSVVAERDLVESVRREVQRVARRNAGRSGF